MHKSMLLLLIYFVTFSAEAQTHSIDKQPNIIFILADDLGYGDVGCYGQQKIETPFIDAMAKDGMRFTQFYAGTTVCAPSRASLMTGMHTGHTDVRGNKEIKPEGQYPLSASAVTVATVLQNAGYETAAFGKWGLGYPGSTGEPLKKGFETFFGYNCQSLAHNYYPDHLWRNNERLELKGNLTSDSVYSADLIHQQAIAFLKQKHSKPFFLYLPYTLPHAALQVPHDSLYQHYIKKFNESALIPTEKDKQAHYRFDDHPHAAFATMVTRLDEYTGEILKTVKELGIDENTLIIFTSDNGPHKEGGADPAFFNSSGGLHGIKRDVYEGGIRVPFIAVWKGKIKAGSISSFSGAFWDMFPTFQQLAGVKNTYHTDGISILPALFQKPQPSHEYLYWEFHENGGRQAVRLGKWKGVRLNVNTIENPSTELYNLETDTAEEHNLAAQFPDIVKKMDEIMQQAHTSNKDWPLLKKELSQLPGASQ